MTTLRMRIACWIPKATHKHSEYVMIIAFQWQQWLHKCVLLLHDTYITCIVEISGVEPRFISI
jgi:hypothetical protein